MTSRTRWLVGLVALLLIGVGSAYAVARRGDSPCGAGVTSRAGAQSSTPFLDASGRSEQPDEDRERAAASLESGPSPFGPVLGAVGYHYEQWAQLSSYAQGIGVRTRDNPDFTMLDDQTLKPLWSVQVDTARSTYDANESTYLVATMPKETSPDLVALDADTGNRRWCASLGGRRVGAADPFATRLLDDGGVIVVGPGKADGLRVARLDRRGVTVWTRQVDADRGDYVGALDDTTLLVGGRAQFELADASIPARPGVALRALDLADGRTAWRHEVPSGTALHVIGTVGGTTVIDERADGAAPRLVGLDGEGQTSWSMSPDLGASLDTALRGGRLLVRGGDRWASYDASSGRLQWRRTMPGKPQLLPYGFTLGSVPLLDAGHALIGATTGLRVLDLSTGGFTATAPLPTDGINTTYWPYQVAVSRHLVAVATNTSALLLQRR